MEVSVAVRYKVLLVMSPGASREVVGTYEVGDVGSNFVEVDGSEEAESSAFSSSSEWLPVEALY